MTEIDPPEPTPVERAARYAFGAGKESTFGRLYDSLEPYQKWSRRFYMRATIRKMRRPSIPMMEAGAAALFGVVDHKSPKRRKIAEAVWKAMIDAMLAEDKGRGR